MRNTPNNQPALFSEERPLTDGTRNVPIKMQVVEGLQVEILPNTEHVYLMTTKEVAQAYGVSPITLRQHKKNNLSELREGIHFIKGVQNLNAASGGGVTNCNTTLPEGVQNLHAPAFQPEQTLWTKAGVVRLGFFIKSERAKLFRDWAEQVILQRLVQPAPLAALPAAPRRKHNRLTPARIIDILADVCLISDDALRTRIAAKLNGTFQQEGGGHV